MHLLVLVLISVACTGHAWRAQTAGRHRLKGGCQHSEKTSEASQSLQTLRRLFLALNVGAAFNPSHLAAQSIEDNPARIGPHLSGLAAAVMQVPQSSPKAKRLILVRHGSVAREMHDPPLKPGSLYGGNLEVPLSDKGKLEAAAAADVISKYAEKEAPSTVQVIASSPMERAVYGAGAIASAVQPHTSAKLDVATYELLRELDRGQWVGLTLDEIAEKWGADAFERYAREDEFGRTVGGEGMADLRKRVLSARDSILDDIQDGGSAVIVSHMWVTRIMVADALGEPDVLKVDIPTASISVVDYTSGSATVPLIGFKPGLTAEEAEASSLEQQAQ